MSGAEVIRRAGAHAVGQRRADVRNSFIGAVLGWVFDGYETFATVLIAPSIVGDLIGHGAARTQPLYVSGILAATLVAWAIGGLVSGMLADRLGRRRVLFYSILWYSLCSAFAAAAPNYVALLALRFLTGIGMGAEWGAGSSLVSEVLSDKNRGKGIALLQSSFGFGFLLAAGAWQVLNSGALGAWRWMYLLGAAPALATVFVRRHVRDPQLWVEMDRRRREALTRVEHGGRIGAAESRIVKPTISQLFETPERRRRVLVLLVVALSTTMGWWAVSSWIPLFAAQQVAGRVKNVPSAVTGIVVAYNVVGIIGYLVMGVLADWLGRKPAMVLFFAGSLVSVPLLFLYASTPTQLTLFAALNGFFTLGQWTWIALYPSELFPTQIRATAISFVFNTTRVIVAGGTLLSAAAIHFFGSIGTAATVIGSGYVVGLLLTPWIGPETKGQPLPTDDDAHLALQPSPAMAAE